MRHLYLFLALFLVHSLHAQIITTCAGDHSLSIAHSGDGGPATAAGIGPAFATAFDASGNMYIGCNAYIRKVDNLGIISTIAGNGTSGYAGDGGPATAAEIGSPSGLAIDAAGNIYIADLFANAIRKINASGIISTIAGTGVATISGDGGMAIDSPLVHPTSVALDAAGNVYFTEYSSRLRKVSTSGILTTVAGTILPGYSGDGGPATAATLGFPVGVALDGLGNIYVVDRLYAEVRKINSAGVISTVAGYWGNPAGYSGDGGPATSARFNNPNAIALDGSGNIYISDNLNNVIRKVNTAGIISTYAGNGFLGYSGDNGPAPAATINNSWGITVDAIGRLYISDLSNNVVRMVDTTSDHFPILAVGGDTVTVCENAAKSINSDLSIMDGDIGQTETWYILRNPNHGTLSGFSTTASSTGSVTMPSGLSYTPAPGFIGIDTFSVQTSDGISAVTATKIVNVLPNNAGTITGNDVICPFTYTVLSDSVSGGVWSLNDTFMANVYEGYVAGISPGTDTVFYTISNTCGTFQAQHIITVLTADLCPEGIHTTPPQVTSISVFPNPSAGSFSIKLPAHAQTITVWDMLGRTLETRNIASNAAAVETISFNNIPRGNYIIQVNAEEQTYRGKITIW